MTGREGAVAKENSPAREDERHDIPRRDTMCSAAPEFELRGVPRDKQNFGNLARDVQVERVDHQQKQNRCEAEEDEEQIHTIGSIAKAK
eukprot:6627008-Prymnesium_polylepis.1